MIFSFQLNNREYKIDLDSPLDISIPLNFNGTQPNAYGAEPASSIPCDAGDLVGDTRLGGSCNFEQYTFIPHCNGTHTECVGHITNERISLRDCLQDVFIPAVLVTIKPENAAETAENYSLEFGGNDLLITRRALEAAIGSEPGAIATGFFERGKDKAERINEEPESSALSSDCAALALIVRTLPNDRSKLTREYLNIIPPFFTTEAMKFIAENFKHLLVDLPSIDRIFDEGKLSNHRIFWSVEQGSFETNERSRTNSTITELIYVTNEVEDGDYLLNLQIAPFAADASPSRPVLFRVRPLTGTQATCLPVESSTR
ncbi:MAG: cyclase family protein [Saprospiraceae bacterium]|nr:cyclase family protein [Pyrinomonadaceae bacterium]